MNMLPEANYEAIDFDNKALIKVDDYPDFVTPLA